MTRLQAEEHTARIKWHTAAAREHIRRIYELEGWRAMGYRSFREYVESELNFGYQWAMKLKDAAVEAELIAQANIEVRRLDTKDLLILRKLPRVKDKRRALQITEGMATATGSGRPTNVQMNQAVKVVGREKSVRESDYKLIAQMMDSGDITATTAASMVDKLDAVSIRWRGQVLEVIARKGHSVPELIPRIAEALARPGSKMAPELREGFLNRKPLRCANLTDREQVADEARREQIEEAQTAKDAGVVETLARCHHSTRECPLAGPAHCQQASEHLRPRIVRRRRRLR